MLSEKELIDLEQEFLKEHKCKCKCYALGQEDCKKEILLRWNVFINTNSGFYSEHYKVLGKLKQEIEKIGRKN
jgi:hypothetical protein